VLEIGINPVAFSIGATEVRWYGIFVALAVLTIVLWMIRQHRKGADLSPDGMLNAGLVAIPSGVIISRLLHVADRWDYYGQYPGQIIGTSGLTIYGAIIGATLGIWICSRFSKFPFGYFADVMAPSIILAQAIGRVGCTINGCCYGTEASSGLPWSVIYTHPASFGPIGVAVHPTQVYESFCCLTVFGVLLALRGHLKPNGSLFMVYLGLYSAWRIGIGFLREGTPLLFNLHQAQVLGIVVLLIIVPLLAYRTHWVKAENNKKS